MATPETSPARRETAPTPPVADKARRAPEQLELVPPAPAPAPAAGPVPLSSGQLWLCVVLPALPLEAVIDTPAAALVFEERQGARQVLLANAAARAAGITAGMPVNAALALEPGLELEERSQAREAALLEALALRAETFTSLVVLEPPQSLLLEIAGSLTLFGGLRALRRRIVQELERAGCRANVAIAPTPLAATWLARAGQRACIRSVSNLVGRLGPLPVRCLGWPEAAAALLKSMGVTTIGECLRLPRQGFAKRFGVARLLELDRALGRLPDPRRGFRAPERFSGDCELLEEQSDSELLLGVCDALLNKLERFLCTRQQAVQRIEFVFFHLDEAATCLPLGALRADCAVGHWRDLLRIHFERLELPAPVIAVRLAGGAGQPLEALSAALPFTPGQKTANDASSGWLAERLGARVGHEAVHGVTAVAEHRPQYAFRRLHVFDAVPNCASAAAFTAGPAAPPLAGAPQELMLRRPLWLLAEPLPLETRRGRPQYRGALTLVEGPERIETGWWDGDSIACDYFVARNPQGARLWIFRDRRGERRWFLHGKFG